MSLIRRTALALFTFSALPQILSQAVDIPYDWYSNSFVDPAYITEDKYNSTTLWAQRTIIQWADEFAAEAPWSVTYKSVSPPSGDMHDYLSWAPYAWPNCTGVGNTTELQPQQVWTTCPYYTRDGVFNPDYTTPNNTNQFTDLAEGVFYNTLAGHFQNNVSRIESAVSWLQTWFLNNDTAMNPNLEYAQVTRGPGVQVGGHTGVLDTRSMAKIVSAILYFRKTEQPAWTSALDTAMVNWTEQFITWLTTNKIAIEERNATNNHGSFYYNQLSSLQILVKDLKGANATLDDYFNGIYLNQISADGEQPFEAVRTRPFHYRCYNLNAMIVNAQIGDYLGYNGWNKTTHNGSTIQTAADFTMTVNPGSEAADELWIGVAGVAAAYGDPTGKYAAFLANQSNTYPAQPFFYWDQPLSSSNLLSSTPPGPDSNSTSSDSKSASSAVGRHSFGIIPALIVVLTGAGSLLYL